MSGAMVDLPAPVNISGWWNFGFLLGFCLVIQIITGIFLSMHYVASVDSAFSSVFHIVRDVNYGWLMRSVHANGAAIFFICIYTHIGRGIYYGSFSYSAEVWNIGVLLFMLSMGTAFVGYVLPWGQMSFWGATVITNLLSAIPYVGGVVVEWVWGGYSVGNATLNRFFTFHFILPMVLLILSVLHIMFLHVSGSSNPIGVGGSSDKIPFHWYFSSKDGLAVLFMLFGIGFLVMYEPVIMGDPENFVVANPLVTPVHIKPEWYFLWAYAILRSIPNKLGGVAAMFSGILILAVLPVASWQKIRGFSFYPVSQVMFWWFAVSCGVLSWIGGCPVEAPYEGIGQIFTGLYFSFFFFVPIGGKAWDWVFLLWSASAGLLPTTKS